MAEQGPGELASRVANGGIESVRGCKTNGILQTHIQCKEIEMLGLTPLGLIHTAISLVALVCGFWALARDWEISPRNGLGQTYLIATFLTAASGLGIFQHGGVGPPHVLSILTILALAIGTVAASSRVFGRASRYVQAISYSATIFFHLVPGVTETGTRLPRSTPLFASAEASELRAVVLVILVVFLVLLALQLWWLRAESRRGSAIAAAGIGGAAH
jgi:uncharacterized membrane protein